MNDLSNMVALIDRDFKLAFRLGGGWFHGLLFFAIFVGFTAFAMGPEKSVLAPLAPALVWLAAALSVQLASADLFQSDMDDGTVQVLTAEGQSLPLYVIAKCIALWTSAIVPFVVATPLFLMMYGLDAAASLKVAFIILIGSPPLALASLSAAALNAGIRSGGLLTSALSAPITIPVLIFGVGASMATLDADRLFSPELSVLVAICLLLFVAAPTFAALSLRLALE